MQDAPCSIEVREHLRFQVGTLITGQFFSHNIIGNMTKSIAVSANPTHITSLQKKSARY